MFTTIVNEVLAGSRRPEMARNCRIPSPWRGISRASPWNANAMSRGPI